MAIKYIGRPRKINKPEDILIVAEEYFNEMYDQGKSPTVSELAYRLGMTRKELLTYEKTDKYNRLKNCDEDMRREFAHVIKRCKQYIFSGYEDRLINDNKPNVSIIFALKNMGDDSFVDKTETVVENKTITIQLDEENE